MSMPSAKRQRPSGPPAAKSGTHSNNLPFSPGKKQNASDGGSHESHKVDSDYSTKFERGSAANQ